jgi:hypothetical protein
MRQEIPLFRLERLEREVSDLIEMSGAIRSLEQQLLHLRNDVGALLPAIVAGDEETRRVLREEIQAGDEQTRRVLLEQIRAGDEQSQRFMLVLHEDLVDRIKTLRRG